MLKRKSQYFGGIMPMMDWSTIVENAIREHSGKFTVSELMDHLPAGITREELDRLLEKFEAEQKIAFDRNGVVGWIYNPDLVRKYLNDTSLIIDF